MPILLERQKLPLILNTALRKNVWLRRQELADWRLWASEEAADIPAVTGRVSVIVTHLRKNRVGMPDVGCTVLAAKAVVDGLVDAKVLPDDGPAVVRRLVFEEPLFVGYHGLRVEILEDGHP